MGVVGWAVFGSAWPGVRSGCQRAFRLHGGALPMGFVLASHLCGLSDCLRVDLDGLGHGAKAWNAGLPGTIGPETGRIPETADLRGSNVARMSNTLRSTASPRTLTPRSFSSRMRSSELLKPGERSGDGCGRQGVRLCQVHAEERRSTPKKRAIRSSALVCEDVDSDEPDLPGPWN